MNQRLIGLFSLAVLALSGSLAGCKDKAAAASAAPNEKPAASVQTEPVRTIEVPRVLRLTGTLRGDRETDLAANASGRVLATSVERGEQVKPGQVLAKLDTRSAALSAKEARAQADSTRAEEEQAQIECARYEQLRQREVISEIEYLQKMTRCRTLPLGVQAASARAALAAQNVGDGVIRAPFAGVVTERYVEVGQYVRQDSRIVTIVSADPLRLEVAVPEARVSQVREGAELSFGVSAYPERRFAGKVRFVSGALRATTRDLIVEAMVPNTDRLLMPGMFADVELTVGSERLPSVPRRAVRSQDDQARLFVVAGGRLEERVVALGREVGDRVAVVRGIRDQEAVVISELSALENGQKAR